MDKTNTEIKIEANEVVCRALTEYLHDYMQDISCLFDVQDIPHIILKTKTAEQQYDLPVRLGQLLDRIKYSAENNMTEILNFHGGRLDIAVCHFLPTTSENPIILTEKEVEILLYLHTHKGRTVKRDDLLKTVWNYADSVETHTVETHIYRLRQKIENDPSDPKIVLTSQDGYMVKK